MNVINNNEKQIKNITEKISKLKIDIVEKEFLKELSELKKDTIQDLLNTNRLDLLETTIKYFQDITDKSIKTLKELKENITIDDENHMYYNSEIAIINTDTSIKKIKEILNYILI